MPDQLAAAEAQRAAAFALNDLPERWRDLIIQVDVQGRRVQDVARELDINPNATSTLLKRAREGLRKSWLVRMHPSRGLPPECEMCVSRFNDMRWGKRNTQRRLEAEAHLAVCEKCQRRWDRFGEQAAVIGMATLGVVALNRDWRRRVVAPSVAAVAGASLAFTLSSAALTLPSSEIAAWGPELSSPTAVQELTDTSEVENGDAASQADDPSSPQAPTPRLPHENADGEPHREGASVNESEIVDRGKFPEFPDPVGEFGNTAHVNINDLDLDGDGEAGAYTNEVWSRWGEVRLRKVDEQTPSLGLGGAEFRILMSDKSANCRLDRDLTAVLQTDKSEYVAVTDENGYVDVSSLWVGDDEVNGGLKQNGLTQRCYVFEEIVAPKGYLLPDSDAARTEVLVRSFSGNEEPGIQLIANSRAQNPWLALTGSERALLLIGGGGLVALALVAIFTSRFRGNRHRGK